MVAYSYKKRFCVPIALGLGIEYPVDWIRDCPSIEAASRPKRQTIRADRRRHARPGEEIQHYCGMRTKGCFLIGRSKCVEVLPIRIVVNKHTMPTKLNGRHIGDGRLHDFAQADGFENAEDMHAFWREEHGIGEFLGVLIRWEPIP